jgi:hypothetical protein
VRSGYAGHGTRNDALWVTDDDDRAERFEGVRGRDHPLGGGSCLGRRPLADAAGEQCDVGVEPPDLADTPAEPGPADDTYVRFIRGEPVDLPPRPILITFDDGYISSFEVADPLLARYGWHATIYVITAVVGHPGRLSWSQLQQMQASGRWDIDEHAGDGHVLVTIDAAGRRLPFYANEIWADGRQESFAHYRQRVSRDIELGLATLARNISGWASHGTFAVPFNNYGQNGSNDPRIEPWMSSYLRARFSVIFVQHDDSFGTPGPGFENRVHVPGTWTADTLETHLRLGAGQLKHAR